MLRSRRDASSSKPTKTILLVDDHARGLAARRVVLAEQGFEVTTAGDGVAALQLLAEREFDLLITDYRMPRMDGLELIRQVRAQRPQQRIVLISAVAETLGLDEASTGADAVVTKNAHEVANLLRAAQRLLDGRRPAGKAGPKPPGNRRASG
jgi:CheY-like chemotaxis protein